MTRKVTTIRSTCELLREGRRLLNADCMRTAESYRRALQRAERIYRRAVRAEPRCSEAWAELGCCLMEQRHSSDAAACFHRALGASIGSAPTTHALQQAIDLLLEIAAQRPDWVTGQLTLGSAYGEIGEHARARVHYRNALRLDASLEAPIQSVFARMYLNEDNFAEAMTAADRSLAADPRGSLMHMVRTRCFFALGRMEESVECHRLALETISDPVFHSDLLTKMNLLAETTPEAVYAEACRWNSLYAAPLAQRIRPHANAPDPNRRLKVGYVSADLYNHAVVKFIPPVFQHHDRSRFDVFVYAVGAKSDELTEGVRKFVENWVAMPGANRECAERIRADGIDILVDLAGHTMGPAHLAFALKPAPIQVSWLGFVSTTGMSTMDYFLGDGHLPCPGTEHLFSETVYRLPVVCCYRPVGYLPVAPAPCLERGYVTFGSFNNPRKITRDVVKLWSAILHLVGESRLLLKYHHLEKEEMQAGLLAWFAEDGISHDRILFAGASPMGQYTAEYNGIDIALDPFPYNGGTTTLDALWMGVPVVTLAGRLAVQRCGASLLSAIGLNDSIANTPEEYLKIALCLAGTVPKIPDLRFNVRQAFCNSPLKDEIGFVRSLESAYREMWQTWCRK